MKNKNICKFISKTTERLMNTSRFIFETEWEYSDDVISDTDRIMSITDGSGLFTVNGITHKIVPGNIVFIFAGQIYSLINENGLQFLYINYSGERSIELYARFGISENNCVFETNKSLIPVWKESLISANDENIDLLSESMLLYAFSQLKHNKEPNTETVQAVIEYISENYTDTTLSLSKMSEDLGYNSKYLSHLVGQKLGVNFSQYVTELRLKQSILLINQGLTSVKNIAFLCGFSDPFYFSNVFKSKFGLSPKDFIGKLNSQEKAKNDCNS